MDEEADQEGPRHDHIAIVSECLREVSMKERGQRPCAAAGGAGGKME